MERKEGIARAATAATEMVRAAQRGMAAAFDTARVDVLATVAAGPLRPREIGAELQMAPSSITRHVQALEDAGQVTVSADPTDARTCLVAISDAGRTELTTLADAGAATFGDVLAEWSDEDVHTLATLLTRLTRDWAERGPAARRRVTPSRPPRWRYAPPPGEA